MTTKYIFISGGVISGVGKGITTASVSLLLKSCGLKVAPIKADPYINLDAGTMNPVVHGETFVTEDGLETDQDLGHYERFLNENLTRLNYMTLGQVFQSVIQRERSMGYGGKCVELVPHIPEEIIQRLENLKSNAKAEVVIFEIGGTSGEYQNLVFLEAARELKFNNPQDVLNIHVAYLPLPPSLGELKSKPVQASVRFLNSAGIQPDIIIGRAPRPIDEARREKIATFCGVKKEDVFSSHDAHSIYEVPEILDSQGLTRRILTKLGLGMTEPKLKTWHDFVAKIGQAKRGIKIAIVGKYFRSGDFSLEDSYICVIEAVKQACWWQGLQPKITWIDSLDVERKGTRILEGFSGIIIPQGWGSRGVEGKIATAGFARVNKIPYLGLCFGMQMAVIEFARNVCHLKDANTEEVDPKTPHPVIHIMPNQKEYLAKHQYGGTIRLGAWPCKLVKGTKTRECYRRHAEFISASKTILNQVQDDDWFISERHRHRYELNNKYREVLAKNGMVVSGVSPDGNLVEAIELTDHPFFIGTQYHPELKSRPLSPHPLFLEFIKACCQIKK